MKNFFIGIRQAISDLVYGRQLPVPERVYTVDIKIHNNEAGESETAEITSLAVQSQSGENIIVLPFSDPNLLSQFAEQHREIMFKYLLRRLTKAVKRNLPSINLFQFGSSENMASISRSNYKTQLNTMMTWFVETEDYESASNCRDLIRQLNENDAVDQPR